MGVDFNRISFGISSGTSRTGFGSIVSFPSEPPSFPPAGTVLETLIGQPYPISEGGATVYAGSAITPYPSQFASVYRKANGTGGNYLDWANAFDIGYYSYGTNITTENLPIYVNVRGNSYPSGTFDQSWLHDGGGGYYTETANVSYTSYGTSIAVFNNVTEVPSGNMTYRDNGTTTEYYHDGYGGSYSLDFGSYYSYGTFIDNIGGTDYYWDGNGGYYS